MEEYKSVKKYIQKKHPHEKETVLWWRKPLMHLINRTLLSALLLVFALIAIKVQPKIKDQVYQTLYTSSISFAQMNDWFQKNLGGVNPFEFLGKNKAEPVFQEKLVYQKAESYKDGVRLNVGNSYLVPALESGIVVFMGEKEGYGKTLIIQQVNGIDVWYSNVTSSTIKLYDYIEKGKMLGESNSDEIFLVFQKAGEYLNYKDYI